MTRSWKLLSDSGTAASLLRKSISMLRRPFFSYFSLATP